MLHELAWWLYTVYTAKKQACICAVGCMGSLDDKTNVGRGIFFGGLFCLYFSHENEMEDEGGKKRAWFSISRSRVVIALAWFEK